MSGSAIQVEGLSKRYAIGERQPYYRATELLMHLATSPWRMARKTVRALPRVMRQAADNRPSDPAATSSPTEFWALRDVSFSVPEGQVLGVIGRNGAGKSTLLKILSRITEPTAGRALVRGRVGSLLEVGTGFHPELTGRENIFLNGAILGMTRAEIRAKFDQIVNFAEIQQFLDTPVKRYSSGMYMRLAFAVAAHLEMDILIVDEVLAVGDAEFQKKCLGKMGEVARGGRTVLFVSHNMAAVEQLSQSILLLSGGKVEAFSSDTRRVIGHYLGSNSAEIAEWQNPASERGHRFLTPRRIWLGNIDGRTCRLPISRRDDVWVFLEATIHEEHHALNCGYALFSENGHLLFWTFSTDMAAEEWPKMKAGRLLLRSRLPASFLNNGGYRIEFIASIHFQEWICEPNVNAPGFYFTIDGKLSDSPHWMNRRLGLLAPLLSWHACVDTPLGNCNV